MPARIPASLALPLMFTELAMASWETMWHRTALMATGTCTHDEYQMMVHEKMHAMQQASMALLTGQSTQTVLQPFHKKATANARRLREA